MCIKSLKFTTNNENLPERLVCWAIEASVWNAHCIKLLSSWRNKSVLPWRLRKFDEWNDAAAHLHFYRSVLRLHYLRQELLVVLVKQSLTSPFNDHSLFGFKWRWYGTAWWLVPVSWPAGTSSLLFWQCIEMKLLRKCCPAARLLQLWIWDSLHHRKL